LATGRVERRLAAILAADVAGYSRLMGVDEEGTLVALKAIRRELADPKIKEHRGRIVKTTGDGLLFNLPATARTPAIQASPKHRQRTIPSVLQRKNLPSCCHRPSPRLSRPLAPHSLTTRKLSAQPNRLPTSDHPVPHRARPSRNPRPSQRSRR
jgi:hypothetical protein